MMEWLKALGLKLKFKGIGAVVVVWLICVTAIAVLGEGPIAASGLTMVAIGGMMVIGWMLNRPS